MAEEQKNSAISKNNSGFPDYLDFDKLRTEGIDYLGRLSGKIWTDHNVHDPGITILEVLCYALLDLGYRTNLPVEDLLTRKPEDTSADNNFFTPAQILACNPLTIIDFRKLLIDIKGVKNAWLEVATDHKDICRPPQQGSTENTLISTHETPDRKNDCHTYLNGLYHVYIDLESDLEKTIKKDAEAKKEIEDKIKNALMTHRNLCEDFIDVYFLCKQETGVCADINLEEGADPEKVYTDIVEKMRSFFSPAPRFYTLPQLLDKQKPIDEIFAGRPYNISESYGFVDTEELEQLTLKKEIHLSDVYNALFEVEGVKTISRLRLQICRNNTTTAVSGWKFQIPKNHVPEFSVQCSGFQFTRRGNPVLIDFKKFDGLFEINFSHNGKVLHTAPSPYLDNEIPQGIYRKDIAAYYSIQNEFPRVYGIEEGGLPDDAPDKRKAQAYQLKGYLLFFDQLLANYLSQLQQMRSLFALSASKDKKENHTYFINQLTTLPDLQKLLRFNINDENANSLGLEGSILLVPVDKKKLLELKNNDQLKTLDIEKVNPYTFATLAEQDTVISQVKDDLSFEQYQCEFVTKSDECIYYYILTCSDEIALISKKYFKTQQEASENSVSVKYIGTFDENYRSFVTTSRDFSFDIELSLLSFEKYLQLIVENETLFTERRQSFLNHLLARFAEQFTDYSLLSFGLLNSSESSSADIKNKETFLTHYDDLSSNRGKAYDYLENNWDNDNVSGFEKKVKAISGISNWKRHSLCNFEVAEYEDQFEVELKFAGTSYFKINELFDTKEKALVAAKDLFTAMRNKDNFQPEFIEHDNQFKLTINYAPNQTAVFPFQYSTKEEVLSVAANLSGLFVEKNPAASVFESTYIYIPKLDDQEGNTVRKSKGFYATEDQAKSGSLKTIKKIDDRKIWGYDEGGAALGLLYYNAKQTDVISFINTDAFKINITNTIVGKPDKFGYELLDKENDFKFQSANEFNSEDEARIDANELLTLMIDEKNYEIFQDTEIRKFNLGLVFERQLLATCIIENSTQEDAAKLQQLIIGIVKKHRYFITIDKVPNRWKFNYLTGYEKNNQYLFHSEDEYQTPDEALTAATLFYNALPTLQIDVVKNDLFLKTQKGEENIPVLKLISETELKDITWVKTAVDKLLTEQKEVKRLSTNPEPATFSDSVNIDPVSRQGKFVYRLIDKDRIPAFYTMQYADKNSADSDIKSLSARFKYGAASLQLCMGGDIIKERKDDSTNTIWYHYQVKCLNRFYPSGPLVGKPLILLESAKGYQSREEAEKAFTENYLLLIHFASDPSNFGKIISLPEIIIHTVDTRVASDSLAFVPKETYEALGNSDAAVTDEIVKHAIGYPIRLVQYKSDKFNDLFPCWKKSGDEINTSSCKNAEEKFVYYFTLSSEPGDNNKWQSVKFYNTAVEVKKEFDFFLLLLWYPGNYYADCNSCHDDKTVFHIYLREVLAESAARFPLEEQAWGKEGVQHFICVSQTEDSFHNYQRKNECCYSSYVACGRGFVYHPCKYDTPQKRDKALLKLYGEFNKLLKEKTWQVEANQATLVLHNDKGVPFATMAPDNRDNICISDRIALLSKYAVEGKNYQEKEGNIILTDDQNQVIAVSHQQKVTLQQWKENLQLFICWYPVKKTKDINNGDDKNEYCIEIKLPGFNSCKEDIAKEMPCGCGEEIASEDPHCYLAWKGKCCYDTCSEAEQTFQIVTRLLSNYRYYQPVFDCNCYGYGIELAFSKNAIIPDDNISYYWEEAAVSNWKDSEIVAINPQCYPSREIACEAMGRAKELINSEGLHVVEHILLRPHCDADCQCREYTERCENKTGCNNFTWKIPDDPCMDETDICFIPGADPYSFIATVALPAWPERFRKKENRQLLEDILYREAPAHVLLRILWLAPHDFCCFETKYKDWGRWLAQKKSCLNIFSVCNFLEFLFNRNYECLDDCNVCQNCDDDTQQSKSCFDDESNKENGNNYQSLVNDIYCWRDQVCDNYEFIECAQREQTPNENLNITGTPDGTILANLSQQVSSNTDEGDKIQPAESQIEINREKKTIPAKPTKAKPVATPTKSKPHVVNSRMNKYRKSVSEVIEKSKGNPLVTHVQRFMADPNPSLERIEDLLTEIFENKVPKAKAGKKLTKSQVDDLTQSSISYYLDKLFFNGRDAEKVAGLEKLFKKLKNKGVDLKKIYDYWNLPEIKEQEPDLDEKELKKLFRF